MTWNPYTKVAQRQYANYFNKIKNILKIKTNTFGDIGVNVLLGIKV